MIQDPENRRRAEILDDFVQKWNIMAVKEADESNAPHCLLYGPLSDYDEDSLKHLTGPLPRKDWTADDYLEILGSVTEDRNHHWLVGLFTEGIPQAMENAGLGAAQKKAFAAKLCEYMAEYTYRN